MVTVVVVAVKVGEVVGNTVLVTDVVVVGSTDLVKEVVGNGSTDAYLVPVVVVVNGGRWSVVGSLGGGKMYV